MSYTIAASAGSRASIVRKNRSSAALIPAASSPCSGLASSMSCISVQVSAKIGRCARRSRNSVTERYTCPSALRSVNSTLSRAVAS